MRPPSPRSLALDLLSTLRGGSMPVGALVAAGALFGIAENGMRVALTRLLARGAIARDERGRYRLGPAAAALDARVVGWRRLEDRVRRWEGGWIGVLVAASKPRRGAAAARPARALRLLGFAPLQPGLMLRADNLRGGVPGVRDELRELGLDRSAPVFAVGALD